MSNETRRTSPVSDKSRQLTDGGPNPNYEPMLQFFEFSHLQRSELRDTSEMFAGLAHAVVNNIPRNPERTVALRKLLEAKDCAVRAMIMK